MTTSPTSPSDNPGCSGKLISRYISRGTPIITGLSSTYLYQDPREVPPDDRPDDIAGLPTGHFVVLAGYDRPSRSVLIADPYANNPVADEHTYVVPIDRVVCSILLGVITYDANFLVIRPGKSTSKKRIRTEAR